MKTSLSEFTDGQQSYLRKFGNFMRSKYGRPIYIYGECLRSADENYDPREWSIRVELSDEDFKRIIGDPKVWEKEGDSGVYEIRWAWADENDKQSRFGHKMTYLNIDFCVYPEDYCRRHFGEATKIKIDTRED